jgi:hypothetical protein
LNEYTVGSQERNAKSLQFASTGRFVHQDEASVKLACQCNHLNLAKVQVTLRRALLCDIGGSDLDPWGRFSLTGSPSVVAFNNHLTPYSVRNNNVSVSVCSSSNLFSDAK